MRGTPNLAKQLLMRHDAASLLHQRAEKAKLCQGNGYLGPTHPCPFLSRIEAKGADDERSRLPSSGVGTAQ